MKRRETGRAPFETPRETRGSSGPRQLKTDNGRDYRDPKTWDWDDVDGALREIVGLQQAIEAHRVTAEAAIATIKEQYEVSRKEKEASIKLLTGRIKKAWTRLKKDLGNAKSRGLPWGEVGTRQVVNLKFDRGLKTGDVIARAEQHGFYDVVKVEKR